MIGQGAHVGAVNSEGDTPLDIAEEEAMEELLQNEVNRQGNMKTCQNREAYKYFRTILMLTFSLNIYVDLKSDHTLN